MKTKAHTRSTKVLWLTDLHLDRASPHKLDLFLEKIRNVDSEVILITGDISDATNLRTHLFQVAAACAPRPTYFVLGNHDFHGSGFGEVKAEVAGLCSSVDNLIHLDGTQIISLGNGVGLIGDHGWADARAGFGQRTFVDTPDRMQISDFCDLDRSGSLALMRRLGAKSARLIRSLLPLALTRFRHVIIATHVPPFSEAVMYNRRPCAGTHLPHFVNLSAGLAIRGIARAFPNRRVTILSGHSHSACTATISPNLTARVGDAGTRGSGGFEIVEF